MSEPFLSLTTRQGDTDYRLDMEVDPEPQSPREGDGFGTMLYHHTRYVLGDEKIHHQSFDDYLEDAGIDPQSVVSLPLYVLDHSGLRMRTEPFDDPWDSGCVGVIFAQKEKIIAEFGSFEQDALIQAEEWLREEVAVFDQYLSGDVYGFRLLARPAGTMDEWVEEDSSWGFFGSDIASNGILDSLSSELSDDFKAQISPKSPRPR